MPAPSFTRILTVNGTSILYRAVQFVPSRFSDGRDQAQVSLSRLSLHQQGTAPDPEAPLKIQYHSGGLTHRAFGMPSLT
ncbi:hypothetical protein J7T55_001801 [Diaporthe amygdali]|uniref:uncharacterized protein n=1 Tax=Phomopsis amygdali TaxID=1214568 RepID=UPI0022FEB81F|nr:uncharacterized protein J7T55_001801 [Diaporthe amygdali]KAJ0117603.1 hypothetical protein J7T55_001801 [Diaporthe amygdali]